MRFSRRDRSTDELVFVSVSVQAEGCLTGGSRVLARVRVWETGRPVRGRCWAGPGPARVGWLGLAGRFLLFFFLTKLLFFLFLSLVLKLRNKTKAKPFIKIFVKILFRGLNTYRIIWHLSCHQNELKYLKIWLGLLSTLYSII